MKQARDRSIQIGPREVWYRVQGSCWICTSHGGKTTYPRIGWGPSGKEGKQIYMALWEQDNGPIPEGCILVSTCRNWRTCINPAHRSLAFANGKGARKLHPREPMGERHHLHKLTEAKAMKILRSRKSNVALAKEMGCTDVNIGKVRKGETWKHIKVWRKARQQ